jgi:hypothetical protein
VIERFKNDERGYRRWRDSHSTGFVFNHFGGRDAGYNVLHAARCSFLARERDSGARTTVEKVCGDTRSEVEAVASGLRGSAAGWKRCASCMGS